MHRFLFCITAVCKKPKKREFHILIFWQVLYICLNKYFTIKGIWLQRKELLTSQEHESSKSTHSINQGMQWHSVNSNKTWKGIFFLFLIFKLQETLCLKKGRCASTVILMWQNLALFWRTSLSQEYKDNSTRYRKPINQLALTARVQEMHLFSSIKTQLLLVTILHTVKVNFSRGNYI